MCKPIVKYLGDGYSRHSSLGGLGGAETGPSNLAAAVRSGSYNPPLEAVVVSVMAWLCDLRQTPVPRAGQSVREP